MLDVEYSMNNRLLVHLGEEFKGRSITPNILLNGERVEFLEKKTQALEEESKMTRKLSYLKKCRKHLRKRYANEYLHALDEKQKLEPAQTESMLKVGRVVLIKLS